MLRLEHISMSYDGTNEVIHDLNLQVEEGQLAVLIGPSGCGKTTTLQMMNRLINPTAGHIYINNKDIHQIDVVQLRRGIGYVIQEIGLFPHMTIEQNIEIVPKLLKWPEARRKARTRELLALVNMEPETYLHRYPANLSGGQQQRIGLLRALAAEPPIILMDEPFGALDPITREQLQDEIKRLQKKLKKTIVFVTHDMDEAIKIADVIVLMKEGRIVQCASPDELLTNPANDFVEQFIGKHRLYNEGIDTVEDVMRHGAVTTTPDKGLAESIALMERKRVSSLLVVDENEGLQGMISIEDLLEKAKPGGRIHDLPLKPIPQVLPSSSAKEAFAMLTKEKLDVIAVVNDAHEVLGVVTKTSMVTSLAHAVWKERDDG